MGEQELWIRDSCHAPARWSLPAFVQEVSVRNQNFSEKPGNLSLGQRAFNPHLNPLDYSTVFGQKLRERPAISPDVNGFIEDQHHKCLGIHDI
jgi:hypothetical protein